jgi:hypothetical protein
MPQFRSRSSSFYRRLATLVLVALCSASASPAGAVCGDFNQSGSVTTLDGLMVLRRSVDLPATLHCGCEGCTVTTSTTSTTDDNAEDECFGDEDCADWGPDFICQFTNLDAYCVRCYLDEHCPEGQSCRHKTCGIFPAECGDVDLSGEVSVVDALYVVHTAVGNDYQVACDCSTCQE